MAGVRATAALVLAALIALIGPVAAADRSAAANDPTPRPSAAAKARQQVQQTAAEVSALAAELSRRREVAQQTGAELMAAVQVSLTAHRSEEAAQQRVRELRTRQSARLRALYVEADLSIALSAIASNTSEDALWWATTGRRIPVAGARAGQQDLAAASRAAAEAARLRAAADQAQQQMTDRLAALRDAETAARAVLARAKSRLEDLRKAADEAGKAEKRAQQAAAAALAAASTPKVSPGTGAAGIPAAYLALYQAAGSTCPGMRWTLLAAVGQVESGHGKNTGPSSAGAVGPMQFMPATFSQYGRDGDNDGVKDPWNPADAIPSAADYLCASGMDGTDQGTRKALFAYNRADWYVDLVLATEAGIRSSSSLT